MVYLYGCALLAMPGGCHATFRAVYVTSPAALTELVSEVAQADIPPCPVLRGVGCLAGFRWRAVSAPPILQFLTARRAAEGREMPSLVIETFKHSGALDTLGMAFA